MSENQITQALAVVEAVKKVLDKTGRMYLPTENYLTFLTKEDREQVEKLVVDGIASGRVAYSKGTKDKGAITKYVPGLVLNHLRKHKALNGGVKYVPGPRKAKTERETDIVAGEVLPSKSNGLSALLKSAPKKNPSGKRAKRAKRRSRK